MRAGTEQRGTGQGWSRSVPFAGGGAWNENGSPRVGQPGAAEPRREPVAVLLVDDDPLVLDLLAETLAEDGHHVLACRSGEECLRALRHVRGHAVLVTDVTLPGQSGRALADEFRRQRPAGPVVFVTGQSAAACGSLGHNETVLLKPFGMRDLSALVGRNVAALGDGRSEAPMNGHPRDVEAAGVAAG